MEVVVKQAFGDHQRGAILTGDEAAHALEANWHCVIPRAVLEPEPEPSPEPAKA